MIGPTRIGDLEVHPVTDRVSRLMRGDEMDAFVADIKCRGLDYPIVLHEGVLVDGRNRLTACLRCGVEPRFVEYVDDLGGDPANLVRWIIAQKRQRQHLTTSQRAMAAARLANAPEGGAGRWQSNSGQLSLADAADEMGVSRSLAAEARVVLRSEDEALIDAVDYGEMTVSAAAGLVRERQRPAEVERSEPEPEKASFVWEESERLDRIERHGTDPWNERAPDRIVGDPVAVARLRERQAPPPMPPEDDRGAEEDEDTWDGPPAPPAAPISERPDYDSDSWSTPDDIIADARAVLGDIDLDPATNPTAQARIQATTYFTIGDDGLSQPWRGRVWLNPPYSIPEPFTTKLVEEHDAGNVTSSILLVNNATDSRWFQALLRRFPACFVAGRVSFLYGDGKRGPARQGQALFYLGPDVDRFIDVFSARGTVVRTAGGRA